MRLILCIVLLFFTINAYSFPLRNVAVGSKLDLKDVKVVKGDYSLFDRKTKRVIFIWRFDKALSKKLYKDFVKICEEKALPCLSIDLSNGDLDELIKFHKSETVVLAKGDDAFGNKLGVFTLPLTIFIDEESRIINAIGYEGNYLYKVSKYIDFIMGKIGKEEFERDLSNVEIISDKSFIPYINLALKYVKEGNLSEANKIISNINLDNLTFNEKIKMAETFIVLNRFQDAEKLLDELNTPMGDFLKGYIRYLEKRYDDSLSILEVISNRYPDKRRLYHLMGLIFYKKGDYLRASKYFVELLGEDIL